MRIIRIIWVKVKWPLFLIVWTAGIIGWMTFWNLYQPMRAEASWTYQESIKLKVERIENIKDNGETVSETAGGESKTESQVEPIKAKAEDLSSAPASGIEVIATTYNAEVGQTDSDPFTMASGKRVYEGAVASNCHDKGTKLEIEGEIYTVEDRMNKRYTPLCGTDKERVDIFKWDRKDNFSKKVSYKVIS